MDDADFLAPRSEKQTAISAVRPYAETGAMVAASTLIGMLIAPRWGNSAVDLLFLPAVLAAAGFYGLAPGVLAAVGSALAFNFYFTEPYRTLHVDRPEDLATVVFLFIVALVTSQLAARMKMATETATASASRNAAIAGFARRLLSCSTDDQLGQIACKELSRLFDCNSVMMTGRGTPQILAARPARIVLTPSDIATAAWAMESGRPAGRGATAVNVTEWVFYPLRSGSHVLAVIGLAREDGSIPVSVGQQVLLDSLIDQVVLAMERARLESEARAFEATRERDRVRSALLSTIGMDFGPRLSVIANAVSGLKRAGAGDKKLLAAIDSEASKLQRYLADFTALKSEQDEEPLIVGDVTIDLFHRTVRRNGEDVHLAPKEYAVLAELAKHPGRVLRHDHLLRTVWGPAHEHQTDYLRVAIRSLRRKLELDPSRPALIVNEPAVGYRMVTGT